MKKTTLKNKTIARPLLLLAFCASVIWSSCRKDEKIPAPTNTKTTTSTSTPSMATLSKQIANNLASSLAGTKGGVNLMGGVDSVTVRGARSLCHCYNNMPLCGFFTDSLFDVSSQEGDTTSHAGGDLKFYFNCVNGQKAGYTAYDSLGVSRTTPDGWAQHYYMSGTATFKAYGQGWALSGTVVFLGNHMADVTINGQVYHVNIAPYSWFS
jgi:hypothetical protein